MRILLDEDIPRRLGALILGHEVTTVQRCGWAGIKNGKLLALAADTFDVFVTMDQNWTSPVFPDTSINATMAVGGVRWQQGHDGRLQRSSSVRR